MQRRTTTVHACRDVLLQSMLQSVQSLLKSMQKQKDVLKGILEEQDVTREILEERQGCYYGDLGGVGEEPR